MLLLLISITSPSYLPIVHSVILSSSSSISSSRIHRLRRYAGRVCSPRWARSMMHRFFHMIYVSLIWIYLIMMINNKSTIRLLKSISILSTIYCCVSYSLVVQYIKPIRSNFRLCSRRFCCWYFGSFTTDILFGRV